MIVKKKLMIQSYLLEILLYAFFQIQMYVPVDINCFDYVQV